MKSIKIGIAGTGVVASGVVNVLKRNQEEITRRAGRGIEVAVVSSRTRSKAEALVGTDVEIVDDIMAVARHPDVDIVVETMGGYEPARTFVLEAIANGKHVVTANKALLAEHGNEIFKAAQDKGVTVAFEAAVAGGIPVIKSLREGLSANRIEWIAGIINGTTNFILTQMREKGWTFDAALKVAQELGYAEADPTFDVEGVDAAHKITLMSALAFGVPINFKAASIEGISKLAATDIAYAEKFGYRIKLLGITKRTPEGIELRVHPTLIPESRLIANVNGVMNAVLVKGDAVGATLYYGAGAGAEPTGSLSLPTSSTSPAPSPPTLNTACHTSHSNPMRWKTSRCCHSLRSKRATTCASPYKTAQAYSPTSRASSPTTIFRLTPCCKPKSMTPPNKPTSSS